MESRETRDLARHIVQPVKVMRPGVPSQDVPLTHLESERALGSTVHYVIVCQPVISRTKRSDLNNGGGPFVGKVQNYPVMSVLYRRDVMGTV